jgi:hypothetical protein
VTLKLGLDNQTLGKLRSQNCGIRLPRLIQGAIEVSVDEALDLGLMVQSQAVQDVEYSEINQEIDGDHFCRHQKRHVLVLESLPKTFQALNGDDGQWNCVLGIVNEPDDMDAVIIVEKTGQKIHSMPRPRSLVQRFLIRPKPAATIPKDPKNQIESITRL